MKENRGHLLDISNGSTKRKSRMALAKRLARSQRLPDSTDRLMRRYYREPGESLIQRTTRMLDRKTGRGDRGPTP